MDAQGKPTTIAILDEFSQIVEKDMNGIDARLRSILLSSNEHRLTEDEEAEIISRVVTAIGKMTALHRHIRGAE